MDFILALQFKNFEQKLQYKNCKDLSPCVWDKRGVIEQAERAKII